MRTICDVCESAPAVLFCAADEAALCRPCDEKVHLCNKLASRHVRVGLADPNEVPRCDICENAPAFFYCEIDGSSLCLQCDMIVHVGGKRTHVRYLMLRQRVEFPGDKSSHVEDLYMQSKGQTENRRDHNQVPKMITQEKLPNHNVSPNAALDGSSDDHGKSDTKMIDLNTRPAQTHGQASNTQGSNQEAAGVVPSGTFPRCAEK